MTLDPTVSQALFDDVVERFLKPELARRLEESRITADVPVYRFQVLLPVDRGPEVRLNEEVGGTVLVEKAEGVEITEGQTVTTADVTGIVSYTPRPSDAGVPHVTAFAHTGGWSLVFEFNGGHARRTAVLERAQEFLTAVRESAAAGRLGVFVDTAHSACELFAKAELLSSQPTIELVLGSRKHSAIARPYHAWANLGNTDKRFPRMLDRLMRLRGPARYLDDDFVLASAAAAEILEVLTAMDEHVTKVVQGRQHGAQPDVKTLIAKRPLKAGQLVTVEDVTIYAVNEH